MLVKAKAVPKDSGQAGIAAKPSTIDTADPSPGEMADLDLRSKPQIEASKKDDATSFLRKRKKNSRKKGDAWKGAKGSGSLALDILKQQQADEARGHRAGPLGAARGPGMDAESNSVMAAEIEAKKEARRKKAEDERRRAQRAQIEVSTNEVISFSFSIVSCKQHAHQ